MKKVILIFMVFSLIVFAGCKKIDDIKYNALSIETQSDLVESSKGAPEQSKEEDALIQLANLDFSIQGEDLSNADNETILEFGKSFVNLYNGAVEKQEEVSFEKYISNKDLRKFTDEMLRLTQIQDLQGGHSIIYGLKNEFREAKLQHTEYNLCYLELPYEFKGSGMTCKMLITIENKSLKLVDLYFGSKDGVDTFATGHHAVREINDPNLWEDEGWVKDVFDKLEELEERLDKI